MKKKSMNIRDRRTFDAAIAKDRAVRAAEELRNQALRRICVSTADYWRRLYLSVPDEDDGTQLERVMDGMQDECVAEIPLPGTDERDLAIMTFADGSALRFVFEDDKQHCRIVVYRDPAEVAAALRKLVN